MIVAHTLLQRVPCFKNWAEFAQRFPSVSALLEAQLLLGFKPSWICLSTASHIIEHEGITVHFVDSPNGRRMFPRDVMRPLLNALDETKPEIVHQHGLTDGSRLQRLAEWAFAGKVRCIAQDHGGGVPESRLRQRKSRQAFARFSSVIFGDVDVRDRWLAARILRSEQTKLLFAASSRFSPAEEPQREKIKNELRIKGRPAFGWVAHLDPNKDPLTVLRAFADYFDSCPEAGFYMHFMKDDLLSHCRELIESRPTLEGRVHLLGRRSHQELEPFYQSLDYFVQASHHEAYGLSVAEAMSTGAIPIVTNIPSFTLLTRNGDFAHLFAPADQHALLRILRSLPPTPDEEKRQRVARYFAKEWSYATLARKLQQVYTRP